MEQGSFVSRTEHKRQDILEGVHLGPIAHASLTPWQLKPPSLRTNGPKGVMTPERSEGRLKKNLSTQSQMLCYYSLPPAIIECHFIASRCKITSPLCADLEHICHPFVLQPDWALCPVRRRPSLIAKHHTSLTTSLHQGASTRNTAFPPSTQLIGWAGHSSHSSVPQPNNPHPCQAGCCTSLSLL